MRVSRLALFAVVSVVSVASPARAAGPWYARPDQGSCPYGKGDGTSYDDAWCGKIDWSKVSAGETLYLLGGLFRGRINVVNKNGSEGKRYIIRGKDGVHPDGIITNLYRVEDTSWTDEGEGLFSVAVGTDVYDFWAVDSSDFADKDFWGAEVEENREIPSNPSSGQWGASDDKIFYRPGPGDPVPGQGATSFWYMDAADAGTCFFVGGSRGGASYIDVYDITVRYCGIVGIQVHHTASNISLHNVLSEYGGTRLNGDGKKNPGSFGIGNSCQDGGRDNTWYSPECAYGCDYGFSIEEMVHKTARPLNIRVIGGHFHHNLDSGAAMHGHESQPGHSHGIYEGCLSELNGDEYEISGAGFTMRRAYGEIRGCTSRYNRGSGIGVYYMLPGSDTITLRDNLIHDNHLDSVNRWDSRAGIFIFSEQLGDGNSVNILNNTITNTGIGHQADGIHFAAGDAGHADVVLTIKNNILANNLASQVSIDHTWTYNDGAPVVAFNKNIWWQDGQTPQNKYNWMPRSSASAWDGFDWVGDDLQQQPMFVDAASQDFHLKDGSPGCAGGEGAHHIGAFPCLTNGSDAGASDDGERYDAGASDGGGEVSTPLHPAPESSNAGDSSEVESDGCQQVAARFDADGCVASALIVLMLLLRRRRIDDGY